ncbi:DUF5710 domain-containing protein [Methylotuvimicrobium alcaliphilum]|uniref:DUF5710 domain-containing protein n=1 Tax=Methylotuvimicrobium alcaliphilum (strain DSM 19304 / NCIMB 14124 / VKM B-2133 / 20Z) TaxID=1091494 RepID=G4T271_META2|nr:DUF5710 domain-containing protein [Methylotuvimicrobium alcaliphilum]CCE22497.1 conserved protein of unknown function [Methylotuvimicrobium alcaliphilum 20Z]
MAESKTYLNVPYAQKDAAKALGARWDPAQKKWYVPGNKDISLFAQWQSQDETPKSTLASDAESASSIKRSHTTNNVGPGVITYATDKDFVAYSGDEPPWE